MNLLNIADECFKRRYADTYSKASRIEITQDKTPSDAACIDIHKSGYVDLSFDPSKVKKTLHNYQFDALMCMRKIEMDGQYVCESTGELLVGNTWQLQLPIGSGKSLIFLCLALFYKEVPTHDIVLSRNGRFSGDQFQLSTARRKYELGTYIRGKESSITVMSEYKQRNTLIITHQPLLYQLEYYLTDFKDVYVSVDRKEMVKNSAVSQPFPFNLGEYNRTKKCTTCHPSRADTVLVPERMTIVKMCYSIDDLDIEADVHIIANSPDVFKHLSKMGFERPYKRIIVDDYTAMEITNAQIIPASITWMISGTGFMRNSTDEIPLCYYSLKWFNNTTYPYPISLVGSPEKTLVGITRNNVFTGQLLCNRSECQPFDISKALTLAVNKRFNNSLTLVHPDIKNHYDIKDYLKLLCCMTNYTNLSRMLTEVLCKYSAGSIKANKIVNILEFKALAMSSDSQIYKDLFKGSPTGLSNTATVVKPLVDLRCSACNATQEISQKWGFVALCCGAFYCMKCVKGMCSKRDDVVRCCCCHEKDPHYIPNTSKHPESPYYAFSFVKEYMEGDFSESLPIDILVHGIMNGYKPKYFDGPQVDDITLLSRDIIASTAVESIENTLTVLNVLPVPKSIIIYYKFPKNLQTNVNARMKAYNTIRHDDKTGATYQSPLYGVHHEFSDNISELIGTDRNVIAIIAYKEPDSEDEQRQLIGRIIRIGLINKIYFYLTCTTISDQEDKLVAEKLSKVKSVTNG